MRILFMVGTHHLPFNRLIDWADQLQSKYPDWQITVQYGTSAPPQLARGVESLTQGEMVALGADLDQVVLPGGPSLMMEWIRRGFRPIIVPRRPELGEHIDPHQIKFSAAMAEKNLITLVPGSATEAGQCFFELFESLLPGKSVGETEEQAQSFLPGVGQQNSIDLSNFDLDRAAENLQHLVAEVIKQHRVRPGRWRQMLGRQR